MQIDLERIERVYSGKIGCMCGCQGRYTTPADSKRSVQIIAKKVMNSPDVKFEDNYAYVDQNGRTRVVYFKQR